MLAEFTTNSRTDTTSSKIGICKKFSDNTGIKKYDTTKVNNIMITDNAFFIVPPQIIQSYC